MDTFDRSLSISAMAPTRSWIVGIPAYPATPRRTEAMAGPATVVTAALSRPEVDGRPSAWGATCECPDACELDHQLD